jgi:hypothetical protein
MAERPTPHSICVCALIALHCEENSPLHEDADSESRQSVDAFLQDCLLHDSHPWSDMHCSRLSSFIGDLEAAVGSTIANKFTDWLQVAASSIDALEDLMMSLQRAVQEGSVDTVSANGIFLRQVSLGYDQLSFESVSLLWKDFYNEMEGVTDETITVEPRWPLSPTQMEAALRQECFDMGIRRTVDQSSYEEMEVEIQRVLQHNPELPYAHFLRFLNCVKHGERVGATDALHRYFDYALIYHGLPGQQQQEILQFAAILLAAMHHGFGDTVSSLLATEEAVRVAQQSKDAACVAFALGWLYSNNSTADAGSGGGKDEAGELLQRCVQRAMEGNLRPLAAGANLSLARHSLAGGRDGRRTAATAWSHLQDASTDPPTTDASNRLDRPTHMTHFQSGDEAMEVLARQRLVAAGIWDSFGLVALSGLSAQIALHCHADQILSRDVVTAIQNIARVSLFGSTSVVCVPDADDNLLASHLESTVGTSGKPPHDCIYANALAKLVGLRELLGLPVQGVFCQEIAMVLHEWAVRRGELAHAEALGVVLQSNLHPRVPNLAEVRIDVYSQKCLRLSRQGRWDESKALAKSLIGECKAHGLRMHHARLLLQLAMIHLESCPELFTSALPPLLECLTMADDFDADGLHAAALSILAQVHLRMRKPKRAIAVLQASLPTILQQEHIWIQAEAYLTLAKCYLQRAKDEATDKTPTKLLRLAARELSCSEELFRQCQDCYRLREVYYLQARVYNSLPQSQTRRDDASENFVRVSRHLTECNKPVVDDFVNSLVNSNILENLVSRSIPVAAA